MVQVVVSVCSQRKLRGTLSEDASGTGVGEPHIERNRRNCDVVAVRPRVTCDLAVPDVAVCGPVQIRIVQEKSCVYRGSTSNSRNR